MRNIFQNKGLGLSIKLLPVDQTGCDVAVGFLSNAGGWQWEIGYTLQYVSMNIITMLLLDGATVVSNSQSTT